MRNIFGIEILKLKNSKALWIVTLAPIFMVVQGALNLMRYYDLFTGQGQNVWEQLYSQSMIFYVSILLPILISIVMTLIARIENTNNNWKHYLSLPIDREKVYGIKFIIGCMLVFINILVLISSIIIAGKILGIEESIPYMDLLTKPMATYIAAFPIMAILYVSSIGFAHMAIPLGIGIGLTLPAMIVANSKFWIFYPWTYPIMAALGGDMEIFNKGNIIYIVSPMLLILVFSFGYKRFLKRDII
ncbi:MAG: ABC transporter permease subunit [Tissierellia bacterium]|nr:ABC transporter permease subunit [Tissierellia bacterium]